MHAVLIANGVIQEDSRISSLMHPEDLIIAADGGASHLMKIGILPQVVVGDLDSLTSQQIDELTTNGVVTLKYPRDKDKTDLEIALRYAIGKNVENIVLLGLLGGRLDHTLANLLILTRSDWDSVRLIVRDGLDTAYLMKNEDMIEVEGEPGDIVSLIPLSGTVSGVTTEGLRWPLKNRILKLGTTLSISNEMIYQSAEITIHSGKMLLVHREIKP